jgi:hypothetical protein
VAALAAALDLDLASIAARSEPPAHD